MVDKTLEELTKAIQSTVTGTMVSTIENIHKELSEDIVNTKVPEVVFQEYFLDMFIGMHKGEANPTMILKWIELAGDRYREVDIVDNDGNKIYSVPSIIANPVVDKSIQSTNFQDVVSSANLRDNHIKGTGVKYALDQLGDIPTKVLPSEDVTQRWKEIFARYIPPTKEETGGKPVGIDNLDPLELNYD